LLSCVVRVFLEQRMRLGLAAFFGKAAQFLA
jgi:hypothetical protein